MFIPRSVSYFIDVIIAVSRYSANKISKCFVRYIRKKFLWIFKYYLERLYFISKEEG